jgi:hypothetical protein
MPNAVLTPLCWDCKHFQGDSDPGALSPYKCAAFPEGIPTNILVLNPDHREPFPGDHGIQFEPKE